MQDMQTVPVQIETQGPVPDEMTVLATSKVRLLLRRARRPVRFARITLAMATNPAMERPAAARANVDVDGHAVRAKADGETMRDAIEHMAARLRRRLERATRNWETRRGSMPTGAAGEWRHQSIPGREPPTGTST